MLIIKKMSNKNIYLTYTLNNKLIELVFKINNDDYISKLDLSFYDNVREQQIVKLAEPSKQHYTQADVARTW